MSDDHVFEVRVGRRLEELEGKSESPRRDLSGTARMDCRPSQTPKRTTPGLIGSPMAVPWSAWDICCMICFLNDMRRHDVE